MSENVIHRQLSDPLLNVAQFTGDDVRAISGLTSGQLKGIIDRNQITLTTNHNPGTGRRRMFTGLDAVAFTSAKVASDAGLPHRWSDVLATIIKGFATRMRSEGLEGVQTPSMRLAFFPNEAGDDWGFQTFQDAPSHENLPACYHVINVTFLVRRVFVGLFDIIDGNPVEHMSLGPPPSPDIARK